MLTTALDAMEVTQTGKWEPTEMQINKFHWIHNSPFPEKGAEKSNLKNEKNNYGIEVNILLQLLFNSYSSRTRRIWADIHNQRGRRPSWLLSAHIRQVREE